MISLCMLNNNGRMILGILGGGQLGRMLIQEALNWNIEVHILDPDSNCPCAFIAHKFVQGSFKDYNTVIAFSKDVDVITIEIEQVNVEALYEIVSQGKKVVPEPAILDMIKDKGSQKEFFKSHNIPSSKFSLLNSKSEILNLDDSWFPCFQKARKDGYDGKGVQKLNSKADIDSAFDTPSVIEKLVDVDKEFSIIGVGDGNGGCVIYPPVEMEFHPVANLVEFLVMPGSIAKAALENAERIVKQIFDSTQLTGLLAVEFFLDKEGNVLLNEMAPRPHNSGHTTIEGSVGSQFEQQLRSLFNFPLTSTQSVKPAIMINLLGEEGYTGPAFYQGLKEILGYNNVFVHLYGKLITKPFRKMGHITILGDTVNEAKEKAVLIKSKIKVISN